METSPTRSPHISLTKTKPRADWLIHAKHWSHTHVQTDCLTPPVVESSVDRTFRLDLNSEKTDEGSPLVKMSAN